jgi:hypothetical protein
MKKFYELLDTRFPLPITVVLTPISDTPPHVELIINGTGVYAGRPTNATHIDHRVFSDENISIELIISGKIYNMDSTSAVVLESLRMDGVETVPYLSRHAVYQTDQAWGVYDKPTSHLGWNGRWRFDVGKPFFHIKHEIKNHGWLLTPNN